MDLSRSIAEAQARDRLNRRRGSLSDDRPNMKDLRIVLLGKNIKENSRVGNTILGRNAFGNEALPAHVEPHSERVRGIQEKTHFTLINAPHLLDTNLTVPQITQGVKECVSLSAPGPHVIILVLKNNFISEEDTGKIKRVLTFFSDQAIKCTMVLTTNKNKPGLKQDTKTFIQQLIMECGGGHVQFEKGKPGLALEIFKNVKKMYKENPEEFLMCDIFEEAEEGRFMEREESQRTDTSARAEGYFDHKEEGNKKKSHKKHLMGHTPGFSMLKNLWTGGVQKLPAVYPNMSKLNLVLCGNDEALKDSISNLILRERKSESSSLCAVSKGEVCGRLITLVELPALFNSYLSEDEVMQETLRCVSLCDPGVHVFLIIVPDGPLTDENRGEIEKIIRTFDSKKHFILLFTTDYTVKEPVTDFVTSCTESQRLIHLIGGRHRVVGLKDNENPEQIPELLDYIEMMTEPYSLQMYMKAQEQRVRNEIEKKHKDELSEMQNKIKELQQKIQSEGDEDAQLDSDCLRIVLIGKTGNGKSETGNTILGRKAFHTEASLDSVTTVCMKGTGEFKGVSVAVVDTPGLFDTTLSNEQVKEEIVKCISLSAPGPHVFIIVLSVGRFTKEEIDTLGMIKMIFGPKASQFSIVLFTRGDDLRPDQTIEQYIEKSKNAEIKQLIRDCGDRFLVFNNREKQDCTQVSLLLNMIEDVKKSNQGKYFTNIMFQEAEMSIKKKVEEILKEKERQIQVQNEELKAKYEREMENMMKTLEEEKKRADEERLQMESRFKEKEETLRKEFKKREKSEQRKREMDDQKRMEEDKLQKSEYLQKIEDMRREIENQREQYEKAQNKREEEDKQREKKYKEDQEKLKNDKKHAMEDLKKRQREEIEKRELEERSRIKEEELEKQKWERKIKEAENDKKEIQEDIKRQQRVWEGEKKRQMREREEDEQKRRERHEEQLREKQEELERLRKKFEREREEEKQTREEERQRWIDAEKIQREQKEREYEEKKNAIKKYYEHLEKERKEDWERIKRVDDERREEERKRWEKMIEDLKQDQKEETRRRDKEEKARKEREEKEHEKMTQQHEEEMEKIQKKHKVEARKKAEEFNEFRDKKEQYIQELTAMLEERQKEHDLLEKLYQHFKKEKTKETKLLEQEIEEYKKKKKCVIL